MSLGSTILILGMLALAPSSAAGQGSTVFGSLYRQTPQGAFLGVPNVPVTTLCPQVGRSSASFTDFYGRYWIYNVPVGQCNLEIWVSGFGTAPLVYVISVFPQATPINPLPI